jgi:hypothetical protein
MPKIESRAPKLHVFISVIGVVFMISYGLLIANDIRGLKVLWRIDPLLRNDQETNNETTVVARQRPARNSGSTIGGGVFYVARSEAIPRNRPSSVQLAQCSARK